MTTIADRARAALAAWRAGGQPAKAISHHPELTGREHVYSSGGGLTFEQQVAGDFDSYAKVYEIYAWIRKAVLKYAEAIAPLPVRVVDADGMALLAHPVTELLDSVNPDHTPIDLWEAYCVQKLLGGEVFLEIVDDARGRPVELWNRRPDLVDVVPDETTPDYPIVAGYVYGERELPASSIIHDKFYNPRNPWRGLAPVTAARHGIIIDMYAQAWSRNFLRSGARPDYGLVAPEGLTETERQEYLQTLADNYSGIENAHKPIILENGVTDIKTFSWAPVDIQWLEQRKTSRVEVAGVFGVPPEIMGWGEANTYENMDQAHRWFWRLTLLPFVGARDTGLTSFFRRRRPMLAPGERVATDLGQVTALQEDISTKAEAARIYWAMGVPWNTVDERMGLGFGEVPGGDTGFVPVGMVPVVAAAERQVADFGSAGGTQIPTEPPGERGNDLLSVGQAAQVARIAAEVLRVGQAAQVARLPATVKAGVPAYGSPRHKALWKAIQAVSMPFERRMAKRLATDFGKQRDDIADALAEYMAPTKATQQEPRIPDTASQFFDLAAWVTFFETAYEPLFTDMTRAAGADALATLGSDILFDLSRPHISQAIQTMKLKFAEDINGTTLEMLDVALRKLLTEAAENGWGSFKIQEELGKRTNDVFGLRTELWQRERIARTEMGKARSLGRHQGAIQSGLDLLKGWLAALDERTRTSHRNAHDRYMDQPIALDALFQVGDDRMVSPRTGSDAKENINCRCAEWWIPQ